jgi:hypothetical protein
MSSVTLSGFTVSKPSSAPTATAGGASGDLDQTANYGYKVTYVTAFGETDPSTAGTVTTTTTGSVNLTAIPVSTNGNVSSRKIYRTIGGGAAYLLLTTLDDNTTTTYTDTTADASLGAAAPTLNSAHSLQTINGLVKIAKPAIFGIERNITAGVGGTTAAAYQLSAEYNWVATVATTNDGVRLPELSSVLIGSHIKIRNNSANVARIFPFTGQTVNGGAADAPVTVAAGASAEFVADLATNWAQV